MTSLNIPVYQNGRWELKKKKQQLIKKSLEDSFESLQDLILETGTKGLFNCSLSGSTLTVLLISDDDSVFAANVGDSKALIIQVDRKSKEHALANPDAEQQDLESAQLFHHSYLTTEHNLASLKEVRRILK